MDSKITDVSVLIAEDEEQLLSSMAEYLRIFFENVYVARDGLSAMTVYNNKKPEIIIADINMPHLDGLSMIEKIREKDEKTKIIITTAHSEKDKLFKAIELNLVKYLVKPVNSDELKELLLSLVDDLREKSDNIELKEGFYWDSAKKQLFNEGDEVELKEKEKKVLDFMCSHPNQTVSAIDIYNHIYEDQPERDFSSNSITSLIKRLRPKLPEDTIASIYGVGYILYNK